MQSIGIALLDSAPDRAPLIQSNHRLSALAGLNDLSLVSLEGNTISDISPLVQNPGLDKGDSMHLTGNPLSDASLNLYIP